ncbi:hypothetical protein GCM10027454_39160 [Algoriphagus aestuariicola]|jgi:hypothetical protein
MFILETVNFKANFQDLNPKDGIPFSLAKIKSQKNQSSLKTPQDTYWVDFREIHPVTNRPV